MPSILKLNKISSLMDKELPAGYILADEVKNPDAIIVRSFKMHDYDLPGSVMCVARAGAGVNNIPVDKYAEKGVVVFNTPGANANAVKELVICSLFLCGRKIVEGINWTGTLTTEVAKGVEDGKKAFIGGEIMGKTITVVGLGAIGLLVANAAAALGMKVIGYDPYLSDEKRQTLNPEIKIVDSLEKAYPESDFVSLHLPYMDSTKGMINAASIGQMKNGVSIVNCARGELVNNKELIEAIKAGKVNKYVTDFPTEEVLNIPNIITVPHLGASTPEAEDNCAVMAAQQMADFFENGNIRNSVNFPAVSMDKAGKVRITILHQAENAAAVLTGLKPVKLAEGKKGKYGYVIADFDKITDDDIAKIGKAAGVLKVRKL